MTRILDILPFTGRFIAAVRNWPLYMLNKSSEITYRLRNGSIMAVRPQDRASFVDVFVNGTYDAGLQWEDMKTIVDIGANIGSFTVFAASKAPHATIISIEPEPSNYRQLQKNIESNGIRAKTYQNAVSNHDGFMALYTVAGQSGFSSLIQRKNAGEGASVRCIRLEEIFDEHTVDTVDVCKIDCEGAEYDILFSLPDAIWQKIRTIMIELHAVEGHEPQEILSLLKEKGFKTVQTEKHVYLCTKD